MILRLRVYDNHAPAIEYLYSYEIRAIAVMYFHTSTYTYTSICDKISNTCRYFNSASVVQILAIQLFHNYWYASYSETALSCNTETLKLFRRTFTPSDTPTCISYLTDVNELVKRNSLIYSRESGKFKNATIRRKLSPPAFLYTRIISFGEIYYVTKF